MADDEHRHRTRAQKTLEQLDGDDEFSVSSLKPGLKPKVKLKVTLNEMPLPKEAAPPSKEQNLFIRLFAKIFR